jgi:heme exporter protein D
MTYVLAGYGITLVVLVLYAARVIVRGRTLARTVGDDDR